MTTAAGVPPGGPQVPPCHSKNLSTLGVVDARKHSRRHAASRCECTPAQGHASPSQRMARSAGGSEQQAGGGGDGQTQQFLRGRRTQTPTTVGIPGACNPTRCRRHFGSLLDVRRIRVGRVSRAVPLDMQVGHPGMRLLDDET
jgi:hypothetical protein